MNNDKSSGGAFVAVCATITIAIIGIAIFSSASNTKTTTTATKPKTNTGTYSAPVQKEMPKTTPKVEEPETWHCQDATSYDKDSSNDNLCISNKGKRKYVSDCEAVRLDPTYCPSQSGPSYYNGCGCTAY